MTRFQFPDGKQFAFTIIDDTDVATVENLRPVYRLLEELGMRTTKTAWPVACPEGSRNFSTSQTLEDSDYRSFLLGLQERGFEMAWHCATMESSTRERTLEAFQRFRDTFGHYPRVHANHAYNRENVYWGAKRLDQPLLRALYRRMNGRPRGYYQGDTEGSRFWWGDLCQRHIHYARNLTFDEINVAEVNPSMPYHDPRRPLVRWWFSAADANDAFDFCRLLSPENQTKLERDGGICIVATHLGKGYADHGRVDPLTRRRFEEIARRPGWFPTVGELLDWLREQRADDALPAREWTRMQWRWARDIVARRRRQRRQRRQRRHRRRSRDS